MRRWRVERLVGLFLAVGLVIGCGTSTEPEGGGTLVFALRDDPRTLDPATTNQITSLQITYQMFETLVKLQPGGTRIVAGLARSWSASPDGRVWTFQLQDGVTFHDGTRFDAAAVCANFERWYRFNGILQSPAVSGVWQTIFGGFATRDLPSVPRTSLYESCDARGGLQAVITLTRPSGAFLAALASPSFSIASPEALRRYEADKVSGSADAPRFEGTFGTQHPVGTGPFRLEQWTPKERLVLVRNEGYWDDKAKLDRVILRYVPDGSARRQALETGEIDGYDPVDPPDIEPLRRAGFQILERAAFNVGSLGINQAKPPFDRLPVRQAVAHALNRESLVRAPHPPGAEVAKELTPPTLWEPQRSGLLFGPMQRPSPLLGLDNPELFRLLDPGRGRVRPGAAPPLYEQANRLVMELLPVVPYVHVPVSIALSKKVQGHAHAPVPWDPYALISVR